MNAIMKLVAFFDPVEYLQLILQFTTKIRTWTPQRGDTNHGSEIMHTPHQEVLYHHFELQPSDAGVL